MCRFWDGHFFSGSSSANHACLLAVIACAVLHLCARLSWCTRDLAAELDGPSISRLEEIVLWVREEAVPQLEALYEEYFAQSIDRCNL